MAVNLQLLQFFLPNLTNEVKPPKHVKNPAIHNLGVLNLKMTVPKLDFELMTF